MQAQRLLFLSQEDIIGLRIPYESVVDTVTAVMSAHAKGLCQVPSKIHINPREGTYMNAMPAYIGGKHESSGLKWVTGYPENRKNGLPVTWGLMVLNDCATGAPLAVMDARWITAVRTAAVAAVTAKYCARQGVDTITIIGAGEQGKWNARLLKIVRPGIKKIFIGDISDQVVENYIGLMQPFMPEVEFVPVRNEEGRQHAIDASGILLTATQRGAKPIIYLNMLHKGLLGIPLESTAWEGKTYTHADRFICDDRRLVETYLADGKYTDGLPETYYTIGEVINGTVPGRANDDEYIISSCHGIALSDVAVAQMIYDRANEKKVGIVLPFMHDIDILR
ncbi:MAG TPA: hypothetical protein PKW29_05390 [Clostridia bacterium]|nr:hypothetical protein [Clostridia bacterium]